MIRKKTRLYFTCLHTCKRRDRQILERRFQFSHKLHLMFLKYALRLLWKRWCQSYDLLRSTLKVDLLGWKETIYSLVMTILMPHYSCTHPKPTYKPVVPNLGYVKSLKGYDSLRITLRFSMKQLTNVSRGYASFIFSAWGYANRKRLGTADINQ